MTTHLTSTRQHGPMLLPPLQDPLIVPAISESTPGLVHLCIRGTFGGEVYEYCTGRLRPGDGPHCGPNCTHLRQVRREHGLPEPKQDTADCPHCGYDHERPDQCPGYSYESSP